MIVFAENTLPISLFLLIPYRSLYVASEQVRSGSCKLKHFFILR